MQEKRFPRKGVALRRIEDPSQAQILKSTEFSTISQKNVLLSNSKAWVSPPKGALLSNETFSLLQSPDPEGDDCDDCGDVADESYAQSPPPAYYYGYGSRMSDKKVEETRDFQENFLKFGMWPELPYQKQVELRRHMSEMRRQRTFSSRGPN